MLHHRAHRREAAAVGWAGTVRAQGLQVLGRRRARAISVMTLGGGVAGTLVVGVAWLVDAAGWRGALRWMGLIVVLLGVPLNRVLSRIRAIREDFWKNAKVVMPRSKKAISLRVDADVLDWFKAQGPGHLSRMNAVLRSFVEAKRTKFRKRTRDKALSDQIQD